jgi:hypothetical protein
MSDAEPKDVGKPKEEQPQLYAVTREAGGYRLDRRDFDWHDPHVRQDLHMQHNLHLQHDWRWWRRARLHVRHDPLLVSQLIALDAG